MSRIVFVNRFFPPDISATSQMLGGVACGLAAKGYSVIAVTSRLLYDDADGLLPATQTHNGVNVHRVWTSRFGRGSNLGRLCDYITFYISLSVHLFWFLRRGDIVIVKTDPPLVSVPVALVARIRRAVVVNWLQDLFPEVLIAADMQLGPRIVHTAATKLLTILRNTSLHLGARTVVIGQLMRQRILQQGVPDSKVAVISNWADATVIKPVPPAQNALRAEWGYTDEHLVVGYSGNMGVAHSLLALIEAAGKVAGHNKLRFLLIGGGKQCQALKNEVQRLGLEQTVSFKPYQPQAKLELSLNVADFHIVSLKPSMEGLIVPSKFYAIAAAGKPVIFMGDEQGELGLLLARHNCGITLPNGDALKLANALCELANNPQQALRMGANARALLESRHSLVNAVTLWSELIESVQHEAHG